jgi:hypothetical protein
MVRKRSARGKTRRGNMRNKTKQEIITRFFENVVVGSISA